MSEETKQETQEIENTEESRPDPVTVSVVEQRLESIAQEMVEVMLRTSMSQILNSSHDYSAFLVVWDVVFVPRSPY